MASLHAVFVAGKGQNGIFIVVCSVNEKVKALFVNVNNKLRRMKYSQIISLLCSWRTGEVAIRTRFFFNYEGVIIKFGMLFL